MYKRTWAEINLDNMEHNYLQMRRQLPDSTRFLGVVKANAYGHGSVRIARFLQELGCDYLAVATAEEALELRRSGVELPILNLGFTPHEYVPELSRGNITMSVPDRAEAEAISSAAMSADVTARVHLKVDSGMGRLGFVCHDGRDPIEDMLPVMSMPALDIEGIFTHFAVSDVFGDPFTQKQFDDFVALYTKLESISGKKFRIKHCTNSGAMINYSQVFLDMVRPGIALYGCYPAQEHGNIQLRPVMELKTSILQIKELLPGDTVSYGRTYTADAPRRIAVIPIGYADGLHRKLSGKMDVLIRGKRAHQIGRICMDMCMVDVTDIEDAEVGDIVTIFGRDGDSFIHIDELAEKADTISYELLCAVSPRVPRIYIRGGSIE